MEPTREEIEKKLATLPESVKDIFWSEETSTAIYGIGQKYKLMVDKIGILAKETGMVMLGFVRTQDFAKNLANKLGVDQETANQLTSEINQKVFSRIREELKAINGGAEPEIAKKEPAKEMPKPAAPSTPAAPVLPVAITPPVPPAVRQEVSPFEHKLKTEEIFRTPSTVERHAPEEIKPVETTTAPRMEAIKPPAPPKPYGGKDPYREPI